MLILNREITWAQIKMGGMALLALVAVIAAVVGWYKAQHQPVVSTVEYVEVPKIKTVTKIKTVKVPGPTQIVTVEKTVVVEKLKLPEWIKTDENKQVIATAEIQPYEGKTDAVAVLDTKTGESQIVAKQVPLPLLGFENIKEIGLRAGVNLKGGTETGIYGRWSFLRVGSFHVGAYGEANTGGDAKAQLEIGYRF
jgi:hypothetical protein